MTTLLFTTEIYAPIELTFNLARSIDVHLQSTAKTREKVVVGRSNGLCELNDEITWEATHFGIRQRLCSKITGMNPPFFFEDTMLKGTLKACAMNIISKRKRIKQSCAMFLCMRCLTLFWESFLMNWS